MSKIIVPKFSFFFWDANPNLKDRARLKSFIRSIFTNERRTAETVNFIFTNDHNILKINKNYLGHNFFTDILTFDLSEEKRPISGEIYISCDRVKENAILLQTSFKEELHRVIFHGVLHLCGYKDKTERQIKGMRDKENSYLSKYFG